MSKGAAKISSYPLHFTWYSTDSIKTFKIKYNIFSKVSKEMTRVFPYKLYMNKLLVENKYIREVLPVNVMNFYKKPGEQKSAPEGITSSMFCTAYDFLKLGFIYIIPRGFIISCLFWGYFSCQPHLNHYLSRLQHLLWRIL